jgi:preprotein translocase subunit SecB
MEEKKSLESGFIIKNILLIESTFSRIETVIFNEPGINNTANVEVKVTTNENTVTVVVTLLYKQEYNKLNQVNAKISMVGLFEKVGESPLDLESFGKVNGAAIIYPYIREHFSNIAVKAGLGLIFLPPVNLTH